MNETEVDEMVSKEEWKSLKVKERLLKQAAAALRVECKDLPRVIERFKKEIEEMDAR